MATSEKPAAQPRVVGTASGVVAAGHTVIAFDEDDERVVYGPGETVTLPAAEVKRLRALHYLKDEDEPAEGEAPPPHPGPSVKQEGSGPTVSGKR